MATKAELEDQLAEQQARIMELEANEARAQDVDPGPEEAPVVEEKPLSAADAGKDAFLRELDEYQTEIYAHRFESEGFVRAFAWARARGNGTKGCLIYADAHELNHESSDAPVALKD